MDWKRLLKKHNVKTRHLLQMMEHYGAKDFTAAVAEELTGQDIRERYMQNMAGGSGNDIASGGWGDDRVFGGQGKDLLLGSSGRDSVFGGIGRDKMFGGSGEDLLFGGLGNDLIDGGSGADILTGGKGDDHILGGTGNDSLWGGQGKDILHGGFGDDVLSGGRGSDTYVYTKGEGNDIIRELDGALGLDSLVIHGAVKDELSFFTDEDDLHVYFKQTGQSVRIENGASSEAISRIDLDDGSSLTYQDILNNLSAGSPVGTSLQGSKHDDVLIGNNADNTIYGGRGDDLLFGLGGDDQLNGGSGNDAIWGGAGDDGINSGSGNDYVNGGSGDDWINSGKGHDIIAGGFGDDSIFAGKGHDIVYGGYGDDIVNGGDGHDAISGGMGDDFLVGGNGKDEISGGLGDDVLSGQSGKDIIKGQAGDDYLLGGAGNDVLIGGTGDDYMDGGTGRNAFIYKRGDGNDVILHNENNASAKNLLRLENIAPYRLRFAHRGSDLVLQILGLPTLPGWDPQSEPSTWGIYRKVESEITIKNGFDASTGIQGIDTILFDSGLFLNTNMISPRWIAEGRNFDEVIRGTDNPELLFGRLGDDVLAGGGGLDILLGGSGEDVVAGQEGGDVAHGGSGNDVTEGGSGNDISAGGLGDDLASGGGGNDGVFGNWGDDLLFGDIINLGRETGKPPVVDPGTPGSVVPLIPRVIDPLALDLNGDGQVSTVSMDKSTAYFDLDGDGMAEHAGWVSSEDGFLALDRNNDGKINDISELFGNRRKDGFTELRETADSNNDGVIDANDSGFENLLIWRDLNQDGVSQTDELKSLKDSGIKSINLDSKNVNINSNNNIISGIGGFLGENGEGVAVDLDLLNDQVNTDYREEYKIQIDSIVLPVLRGYGAVKDAFAEYNTNGEFKKYTQEMIINPEEAYRKFDTYMSKWTGLSKLHEQGGIEHHNLNMHDKVWILESFAATDTFRSGIGDAYKLGGNPAYKYNASSINKQFTDLKSRYFSAFAAQAYFGDALDGAYYSINQDRFVVYNPVDLEASVENFIGTEVTPAHLFMFADLFRRFQSELELDSSLWSNVAEEYHSTVESILAGQGNVLSGAFDLDRNSSNNSNIMGGFDTDDIMSAGNGNDTVFGGFGHDILHGNKGNDFLSGGGGDDSLYGEYGSDKMEGGVGNDYLSGGEGNNTYVYTKGDGHDVVYDLKENDAYTTTTKVWNFKRYEYFSTRAGALKTNSLEFRGISLSELSFFVVGDDLLIKVNGENALTVRNAFNNEEGTWGFDSITLDDGTVLGRAEIASSLYGTDDSEYLRLMQDQSNLVHTGAGDDTVHGGSSRDAVSSGSGDDRLHGFAGDDVLSGAEGSDHLYGGVGNDTLSGGAGNDHLFDSVGNNSLIGGSGNDIVIGGIGSDKLSGGVGNDYLSGGEGNNTYVYTKGDGHDVVYDLKENDAYTTTTKVWNFKRYEYFSTRAGALKTNSLEFRGISLSELSFFVVGDDLLIKVNGENALTVRNAFNNEEGTWGFDSITLDDGTVLGRAEVYAATDFSLSDDIDRIEGNSGNEEINGTQQGELIYGFSGNDALDGDAGDDRLYGGAGNDTLSGGTGDDYLSGGDGNNIYVYTKGDGHDVIEDYENLYFVKVMKRFNRYGGGVRYATTYSERFTSNVLKIAGFSVEELIFSVSGSDLVIKLNEEDSLTIKNTYSADGERWGVDSIVLDDGSVLGREDIALHVQGSGGDDTILGRDYSNSIKALSGNDVIYGGAAADTLSGGVGNDELFGGSGDDSLLGGTGNDILVGDEGNDVLSGGSGKDILRGSVGNDALDGDAGDDRLYGGAGNDTLSGGTGDDYLSGGDGNNIYVYTKGDGHDVIEDYENLYFVKVMKRFNRYGGGVRYATTYSERFTSNILKLHAIKSSEVTFLRQDEDLIIKINGEDSLTIKNMAGADSGRWGLDSILFDDGTALSRDDIFNLSQVDVVASAGGGHDTLTGTSQNDTIYGNGGEDRIDGGGGHDKLFGGTDNDLLLGGTGDDSLYGNSGSDVLDGGVGNDLLVGSSSSESHGRYQYRTHSGTMRVPFWKDYGLTNTLIGGTGNDTMHGGDANNNYIYNLGDGHDTIVDVEESYTYQYYDKVWHLGGHVSNKTLRNSNTLHLNGISVDDIRLEMDESDMRVLIGNGEGSITVKGQYRRYDDNYGIDKIVFDDGLELDRDALGLNIHGTDDDQVLHGSNLRANGINGEGGDDVIFGGKFDDVLAGGKGTDTLHGGEGKDTYVLEQGAELDVIKDSGGTDTLRFGKDVKMDNIWFMRKDNDLTVGVVGTKDKATIKDWYFGDSKKIERFETQDGSVLVQSQVQQLVDAMAVFSPEGAGELNVPADLVAEIRPLVVEKWKSQGQI